MNRKLLVLVVVLLAAVMLPARWASAVPAEAEIAALNSYITGEPNDTFETANDAQEGFLMTPDDVDFIRVLLDRPTHVELQVNSWGPGYTGPGVLRVQLAFYDAAANLLAEDADCGEGALVNADVPAGSYVARIRACPAAFDPDQLYMLVHTGYSRPIEWEPNNSRATANGFDDADATIEPAGDVDYYRFEGTAGETWYASLESNDDSFEPEVALVDATGAVLATSGPGYLTYDLTSTATYYFRVRSGSHPPGTGSYRIYGSGYVDDLGVKDVEPNDTPAQAVPAAYGDILSGYHSNTDLVDYYKFSGQAGDPIAIAVTDVSFAFHPVEVTLLDPALNPVSLEYDWPTYLATLPTSGVYSLGIANPDAWDDSFIDYAFLLLHLTGDEPNNTMATATDVAFGPTLDVQHDYLCDNDWYRFQGRAGDVLAGVNTQLELENVFLYDTEGNHMGHVLPADGTYYLNVRGYADDKWDTYCQEGPVTYPFGEALWVSAAVNGLGGNAAIKAGDIVTRKNAPGTWQIVFDASDVGITKNVNAFERMPNGSILMSLAAAQNVPGLGKVMPQDIIRFSPTALGDTTAGTFQWYLDGSDVGLTTAGEKIDAITLQHAYDNPLRISTTGAGAVARQSGGTLTFADEDMINFVGTAYGATSAGKWRMNIDGSDVPGMAAEDITAATRVEVQPERDSQTLLSFDSAYKIEGTSGTFRDVSMLYEGNWRQAVQNMTDKKIDGLSVGPAWTP